MKTKIILFVVLTLLIYSQNTNCASLDGTTNIVYKDYHYPFANSDTAEGFVKLASGFTIPASATVTFNIHPPISGGIQLNDTGTIQLNGDIYLDSSVTLSNGGYINGQGNSIILTENLTIPDGKKLVITGNTTIEGNNFDLILGHYSQLLIDSNKTLTLKNIHIKNTYNDITTPQIRCLCTQSKLTLDNVIISCNDDFIFKKGQMYINNDVIFTGTSKFVYKSFLPSYIQPHSTLYFDKNTSFDYSPSSTRNDLITLIDETSSIYLDNCTLQTTATGIKLTKGQLFFDNNITLSCKNKEIITSLTSKDSTSFGTRARGIAWSPDKNYLAVTGDNGSTDLIVYSWDGSTLTQLDTKNFILYGSEVSWSPDGNYLAVGGQELVSGPDYNVLVYSWNGSTLTQLAGAAFRWGGTLNWYVRSLEWSPCGNYLAVGGQNDLRDLIVYSWDGSSLSVLDYKDFGIGPIYSLNWINDGSYLAAVGSDSTSDIRVYSWNGSTLTQVLDRDFGNFARSVAWSPDGKYLAVGGDNNPNYLRIYSWNGSTVNTLVNKNFGASVSCISWSFDGSYLAVGGDNGSTDIIIYSWNGSTLTQVETLDFGTIPWFFDWSLDENYLAVGGNNGSSDIVIYDINYTITEHSPTTYNSIIFGDSSRGSEYNLNTYLLSGAQVDINCPVWIDDAD